MRGATRAGSIRMLIGAGSALLASACSATQPTCDKCPVAGGTQCVGAQIEVCTKGPNGCLDWGTAHACPIGQGCVATQNACVTCDLSNACATSGATRCDGADVQICAVDPSGCLGWGSPTPCSGADSCDGPQGKCSSCASTCLHSGATQCSGDNLQVCSPGSDGCFAWGAPSPCPKGQFCDPSQGLCADTCTVQSVLALCTQAATQLNACCVGGFGIPTPGYICGFLVDAGLDPRVLCTELSTESCPALHVVGHLGASPFPQPTCCCPQDEYCDLATPDWACVPSCRAGADCPAALPNCVPSATDQNVIGSRTMICSAAQAQLWGACDAVSLCCPAGSDCIRDANLNPYCAPQCSTTQPCGGDPAVACCLGIRDCPNCNAVACTSTSYCEPCP